MLRLPGNTMKCKRLVCKVLDQTDNPAGSEVLADEGLSALFVHCALLILSGALVPKRVRYIP